MGVDLGSLGESVTLTSSPNSAGNTLTQTDIFECFQDIL